jgi:hypothetical protein
VSTLVFVLFMAGMFGIGVWLGWHMAHINTRIDADLAEYISTGSLPALSFVRGPGRGPPRTPNGGGPRIPDPQKVIGPAAVCAATRPDPLKDRKEPQ